MIQEILEIVHEINPYDDIDATSMLLEEGFLDSLGIIVLISELEEKYSIKIPLEKLDAKDFETVSSIAKLVERVQ